MSDLLQNVKSLVLLQKSLDLRALRHLQIVSNIANSSDPDYKPFEAVLDGALKNMDGDGASTPMATTDEKHLQPDGASGSGGVVFVPQNTELEQEMSRLVENNLMYNASVELLNRQLRIIKLAVMDRA